MVIKRLWGSVLVIAGLALFIIALELLKTAAHDLTPILTQMRVSGLRQSIGFGWLGAYLVLSGSPIAAISLTLYSSGAISDLAALGMMTVSRLGASFIVLFVGFLYYLRGQRRVASVAIGVLAFLVTATIYLPALVLGVFLLRHGYLDGIRFASPPELDSMIDLLVSPIVSLAEAWLPSWGLFVVGVVTLLSAFRVFDLVLPSVDSEGSRFSNLANAVYRPIVMFAVGALFTSLTMSVSVSLTLLVPLATRGYVRRENIIPYIMGANITTFIDTLVAALLLGTPRAFTIVVVEIVTVSFFSLLILGTFYPAYQRLMNRVLNVTLASRWTLLAFVVLTVGIPIVLLIG
jgi:solute carrier family 34 (sodium-dependent phosphate cotransporter)